MANKNFWKNKSVFITGAGGFIGSHLTREISEYAGEVNALIHYNSGNNHGLLEGFKENNIKIIMGDICDGNFLKKVTKKIDIIFHLAALIAIPFSYESPTMYVNTNITGTLNVLNAAIDNDVKKVVHTSTSEVYGTALYTPIDEKHPLQGQSPYSATKISADKIAESFYLSFGVPVATIRPFNTFGPGQSARAVIPTIVSQAIISDNVKLGSLEPVRDLNFVKDTVSGFIKVAECENSIGEVINIGRGAGVSIGDLAAIIFKVLDKSPNIVVENERIRPEKSEVLKLICDNSKAKKMLNWEPEYSLEEGIFETVKWIEKNIHLYKTECYVR